MKLFVLFFYTYVRPYFRQGFNFFKIIQEIHFILISIFLIFLDELGQNIEENAIIDESLLEKFLDMGERLI
jgi:hypothetical protein